MYELYLLVLQYTIIPCTILLEENIVPLMCLYVTVMY